MQISTTLSQARKIVVLCLTAAVAAAAFMLSTPGDAAAAGTAASWKLWQLDGDRCWDAATLDANFNGYAEDLRFDLDNDCRWDTRLWNSVGGDHFAESLTYDMNEDGRWELWLVDTNQREGFEIVYFDDNADGYYDRWAYVANAAPRAARNDVYLEHAVVGGTPQYDGLGALQLHIARHTGQATWPSPDSDSDGWPNHIDRYPYDKYRR